MFLHLKHSDLYYPDQFVTSFQQIIAIYSENRAKSY